MRLIKQFDDENKARVFSDYLYINNIKNELRTGNRTWDIWVLDEDQLGEAENMLQEYLDHPDDLKYKKASRAVRIKKAQDEKIDIEHNKKQYSRTQVFSGLLGGGFQFSSVTGVLIICSVLVTLLTYFSGLDSLKIFLSIAKYKYEISEGRHLVRWLKGLQEISDGQVWRLITPIFLHFGIFHIIFNMMWLKDLGSMIEKKQGPIFFAIMVLIIGIASNIGQYIASGPLFGGMSGVVYGLVGYIWIRGKFDPMCGLYIHKHIVIMMIAWFFLCLTGIMGSIGNTAHAVGLGVGVVWGYLAAKIRK